MKKIFLALSAPIGLAIELIYSIGQRLAGPYPDAIAYPMMIVSVVLCSIGLVYYGYCLGKRKNPYDFKK